MGKRKHLGLLFNYNENWIGGTYYIVNLIHALNLLPDLDKPTISVITTKKSNFYYLQDETKYPYLSFVKNQSVKNLWEKMIDAVSVRIKKRAYFNRFLPNNFDLLFPNPSGVYFDNIDALKKVYWIPDFQEIHLPDFFSVDELIDVKQRQIAVFYKAKKLVLSSMDARNDFLRVAPDSQIKLFIIPFTVTHPDISATSFNQVADHYTIDRPFYFSPNQFWLHKNQLLLIQAVKLLVDKKEDILVIFSGKESDHRNPGYIDRLKKIVTDEKLENNVKFLGFIDRREQLTIMKNAIAVVQPSLFEGWNTSVEDAKALGKKIVASAIDVHREQLKSNNNCVFFNPSSAESLSEALLAIRELGDEHEFVDYNQNRLAHAQAFMTLFDDQLWENPVSEIVPANV